MTEFDGMRVALVHEWLDTFAGSERVVEEILKILPRRTSSRSSTSSIRPTGHGSEVDPPDHLVQNLPFARKRFRSYLPLMPVAIEQLDLSAYDLVLSSSHAVAKGVITGPDQVHVSYVHSPMRYAWDLQHRYLQEAGMTRGLRSVAAERRCTTSGSGMRVPPPVWTGSSPTPRSSAVVSEKSMADPPMWCTRLWTSRRSTWERTAIPRCTSLIQTGPL